MAGEWPTTWKRARLGEVADVNWGDTSVTKASYVETGFRAYSASGPDGFLPYADFDRVGVVLSAIGADCGKTWLAKGKWSCIKNTLRFWSVSPEVDTEFLYWLTHEPSVWPKRGSAQPFISQADARALEIAYPPLPEQRAIAHILGTLDDKIELNRRMSETLEAMARALFKAWFVDFEPVRAKMEGRWRRGQSLPGLPAHLYDLFPDRLVDSELGPIPEGSEVWCVRDIGNVVCGKTPSTKIPEYYGDDVPFITIPDMHGNIFVISTQKKLSHVGASSQARKTLPAGSICVSCIATPGLVVITTEESQTNQQINSVIPNQPGETYYWFWVLRDLGNEIKAGGSGGSVLTNLSTGRFSELRILACKRELRRAYHSHVVSIFEKILTNLRETKALAALRDALLPKLISGELRVKDVERFLKERQL